MGNSATKEQRPLPEGLRSPNARSVSSPISTGPSSPAQAAHPLEVRLRRPDFLASIGSGSNGDQDAATLEVRRETKQEREARRAEKERITRGKERERSMREEHIDGGYLVTQGVYAGIEDYNKAVVRHLMVGCYDHVERRS